MALLVILSATSTATTQDGDACCDERLNLEFSEVFNDTDIRWANILGMADSCQANAQLLSSNPGAVYDNVVSNVDRLAEPFGGIQGFSLSIEATGDVDITKTHTVGLADLDHAASPGAAGCNVLASSVDIEFIPTAGPLLSPGFLGSCHKGLDLPLADR